MSYSACVTVKAVPSEDPSISLVNISKTPGANTVFTVLQLPFPSRNFVASSGRTLTIPFCVVETFGKKR